MYIALRLNSLIKIVISLLLIVLVRPAYSKYERVYHTADFEFFSTEDRGEFILELDSLFLSELNYLQKKINYYTNNRLQIFLSAAESRREDFQTPQDDQSGEVLISNSRVIINTNSSLTDLRLQFKEQVAKILVEQLMYGSALQDKIKSSNMINLPDWFLSGLYHYLSRDWDVYSDNQLRQVYDNYGLTDFNSIPLAYSAIKGASFWKYIESAYGPNAISVLLYNARISPKFNAAIYYSYQAPLLDIYRDWKDYYESAYQNDQKIPNPIQGITKNRSALRELYVVSAENHFTVEEYFLGVGIFRYDNKNKRKLIYSLSSEEAFDLRFHQGLIVQNETVYFLCQIGEYSRLIEIKAGGKVSKYDFPFYSNSFTVSASQILIVSPRIDESSIYSVQNGEVKKLVQVEGYINSLDIENEKIAFIVDHKDTSSLRSFMLGDSSTTRIVFRSQTKLRQVIIADDDTYLYNSMSSGIWNGKLWSESEDKEKSLTNYRSNILFHQYSDSVFVEYLDQGLNSGLFITEHIPVSDFFIYDIISPSFFYSQRFEINAMKEKSNTSVNDSLQDYTFISPVSPVIDFTAIDYDSLSANQRSDPDSIDVDLIAKDIYKPYSVHLKLSNNPIYRDEVVFEDNIRLLTPNRLILNLGGSMANMSESRKFGFQYGGLLQQGTRDLLFKYSTRARCQTDVNFLNRKRTEFRTSSRTAFNSTVLSIAQRRFLGKRLWLSLGMQGRYDLNSPLLVSSESLTRPLLESTTISASTTFNYRPEKGRHKFDLQASFKPMIQNGVDNWNITGLFSLTYRNSINEKLGLISKTRLGSSQGTSPVYFVLGGHHTDLRTDFFDRDFADYKNPIQYHSIYGIRGFNLNYRNGNTFFLHTTEFSVKLLEYIFQRPIASEVFSNLSLNTSIDMGTSFYGKSIYDRPNLLNIRNISSSTEVIRTEVRAFKNPFIFSTGLGLSSRFYGYNLSVDYAWGYEDQTFKEPVLHIGLGHRF